MAIKNPSAIIHEYAAGCFVICSLIWLWTFVENYILRKPSGQKTSCQLYTASEFLSIPFKDFRISFQKFHIKCQNREYIDGEMSFLFFISAIFPDLITCHKKLSLKRCFIAVKNLVKIIKTATDRTSPGRGAAEL